MSAYQDILSRAQGVANKPYTSYTGELVAPVNTQQNLGIGNINQSAGFAAPYIQQAIGYATDAAQPITQEQIQYYTDPYTQRVIQATQEQFRHGNAEQQQGVIGNAAAQGALGGNRVSVAQAQLAEAQQRAQAPVLAGLASQGFTTGLNTALTEQQARAQAAYSLGNLGVSGQNAGLTGANAQIGAGTLQQGTRQAEDAARYQQFINAMAYDPQITQWLAGIGTGVGSQMGGTSTAPAPSQLGQIMGGITSGVGALGGTGAFGASGWLAPAASSIGSSLASMAPAALALLASGGAVRRASGGVAPEGAITLPETPETLKLQQRQLLNGHRRVQMFPRGTPELPLPRGMNRTEHANGSFHYDPRRIDEHDIHRLSNEGRENDMLDLGPYSKDDVLKRVHGGEVPVAVVERHPDGTEVRSAIGTHTTADRQMAAMNRTKSPGHIVRIEDPRETIGHRIRAFGGRVPGFAGGGAPMEEAPPTNGVGAVLAGTPYRGGSGWIPRMDITRGPGAPRPAGIAPSQPLAQQAKEIGSLANIINGRGTPGNYGGSPETNPNLAPYAGQDESEGLYRGGMVHRASGGVANLPFHHMVPHLAEGGSPYDTDYFDDAMRAPPPLPSELNTTGPASWESGPLREVPTDFSSVAPGTFGRHGVAPGYDLPPEIMAGTSRPRAGVAAPAYAGEGPVARDQPSPLDNAAWPQGPVGSSGTDYAMERPSRTEPSAPRGVAPGINFGADSKLWPALMTAGLGMLASKSPHAGVAIGEGGLAGMQAYSTERQREDRINSEVKKLAQEAEFAQKRLDLQTRPFTEQTADQRARSEEARLQHERPYSEQTADQKAKSKEAERYHDILGNRMQLRPTGTMVETPDGPHPVFIDSRSGASIDGITGDPVAPDAKIITAPGKAGAIQTLARELIRDREEQRKTDPSIPALSLDEAVSLAHRSPDADRGTARRLNMAQGAWKAWTSNPLNMSKKDAPENKLEFWENRYGVTGAAPAGTATPTPRPTESAAPAAVAPTRPTGVPSDAKPQRNKTTGAYRWVAPDGTIYSADGVKQ